MLHNGAAVGFPSLGLALPVPFWAGAQEGGKAGLERALPGPPRVTWKSRRGVHKASARAKMRVLVKRILRKYGYPPDLQDAAIQTVLQQAEVLSAQWAA